MGDGWRGMTATYTTQTGSVGTRTSRRLPCPVCDRTHGCLLYPDGGVQCHHVESDRLTNGGWYHAPRVGANQPRPEPARAPRPAPRRDADPDTCDRAYRALLVAAGLSQTHRANLRDRGMSDAVIDDGLYATLPADDARGALVAAAAAVVSGSLVGSVPGFVRHRGQVRLVGVPGLLVPVQDMDGRVVGLRVRPDERGDGGKYRWISDTSADPNAVGIDGHTIHVAYPLSWSGAARYLPVVEGELKARISAERFGVPVLSVPGVANTRNVAATLAALGERFGGLPQVPIAYDADAETNPQVAAHEMRLAGELVAAGFRVVKWTWSASDGKGLDNLLAAGLLPLPTLYDAPGATPGDDRSTRAQDAETAAQVRQLQRRVSVQVQVVANSRALGGDVGGKVALLLVGELAHQHTEQPAADGFYPVTGSRLADAYGGAARMSPATARSYVSKFADAGLLEVQERREFTRNAKGETVPVKRSYVKYNGDANAMLETFAHGSVYADGEERPQRGGSGPSRPRRLPVWCPSCGGENVAVCMSCGTVTPAEPVAEPDRSNLATVVTSPQERSTTHDGDATGSNPDRSTRAQDEPGPLRSSRAQGERADRSTRAHGEPEPDEWDDRALTARDDMRRRRNADADRSTRAQGEQAPLDTSTLPGFERDGVAGMDRWTA
jgi:Domain of unknown function (DUF3854)